MKKLLLFSTILTLLLLFTGCVRPYDTPEFVTIEPSQSAFLIKLQGNIENQGTLESEDLLSKAKVATKEIQITHVWRQTGRMSNSGDWVQNVKLIVV
jgi:hypothetical protein